MTQLQKKRLQMRRWMEMTYGPFFLIWDCGHDGFLLSLRFLKHLKLCGEWLDLRSEDELRHKEESMCECGIEYVKKRCHEKKRITWVRLRSPKKRDSISARSMRPLSSSLMRELQNFSSLTLSFVRAIALLLSATFSSAILSLSSTDADGRRAEREGSPSSSAEGREKSAICAEMRGKKNFSS